MPEQDMTAHRPGFAAQLLRRPGFLPCVALLTIFAVCFHVWTAYAAVQLKKLPLPLRAELDTLDKQKLFPYQFLSASALKAEMVDSLGTNQYISWMLRDTTVTTGGAEQLASLFVTYYTGKPDQVPHVPDVCYQASGYSPQDESVRDVPIPALGITIPIKVLELEKSHLLGRESRVVMYTFGVNGKFAADRRDVQVIMANPFEHYAYFSKVEITFGNQENVPPKDVALRAGERLLQVVIPILVSDHWPDWNAAIQSSSPASSAPAGRDRQARSSH
jgi:hypothetical protein